jgi:hypothetical protein
MIGLRPLLHPQVPGKHFLIAVVAGMLGVGNLVNNEADTRTKAGWIGY